MDANGTQLAGYKRKRIEDEEDEDEEIIMLVVALFVLSLGTNYMSLTNEPYSKAKRDDEGSSHSSRRSKKDKVGDALMMVADSLTSYFESKNKKEEKRHSTTEIYKVLCDISGLSRAEIAKAVIKYNNSDHGQFNLLLDIPSDERKLFVECFLSEF